MFFSLALLSCLAVSSEALFGSSNECPTNSDNLGRNVCAVLYDDEGCDGWDFQVSEGYTALPFLKKNDAESVAVAPGCKLIGYDHNDERSVEGRGNSVTIDARRSRRVVAKDLSGSAELEEKISAVECRCSSHGFGVPDRRRPRTGNSGPNCDNVQFRGNTACIVYDDEDCKVEDWDEPLSYVSGESKSFSILKAFSNRKFKNTIESISVKAGCTLEVFDDSDYSDDGHAFIAPPNADLHATLDRSARTNSLDDDIESLRCYC